ncbi:beta-ketoacyl-[acyl-carrier-protein] synthase family protein [Streptomyces olivaceoviridis]
MSSRFTCSFVWHGPASGPAVWHRDVGPREALLRRRAPEAPRALDRVWRTRLSASLRPEAQLSQVPRGGDRREATATVRDTGCADAPALPAGRRVRRPVLPRFPTTTVAAVRWDARDHAVLAGHRPRPGPAEAAGRGVRHASGHGARLLATGAADAVVVGGAEASTSELVSAAFRNAGALSPTGRCLPFDTDRDGFVIGEGAGVLVLETAGGAARRGAEVLGAVRGYGATSDAHHLTAPDPGGGPAAEAVTQALRQAGTAPGELDYLNAHGTGTLLNDRLECDALRLALGGDALARIPMSSSKGSLGHLFGAAGAVEAIATLQALRHGVAPATAGLRQPDERLGELDLIRTARALPGGDRPRAGLSTSFGFGGHNAALVLSTP